MERIASAFPLRLFLSGCLAALLAGCADSERMTNPFSDPFAGDTDRTPTASIAPPQSIASRPLPPVHGAVARYAAPAYPSEHVDRASIAGWTAEGGTPIVMAQGESAEIIARRYGIPTAALLRTNGFTSAAQVRPGTRLIIPTYNVALAASSGARLANRAPSRERLRFVKGPQPGAENRLAKLAHSRKELGAEKASERKSARLIKPVRHEASIAKPILAETQLKRPSIDAAPTSSLMAEDKNVAPEFRWPAHGRIIQAYRAGGNDGINIALPEGTSVKAAEAGIVAYAGDGLQGYGNLVLIRHPDGFVSAYANNSQIEVKRGDVVKRGQVIAKSGQSGNVASPQLHFELRKGSTPVDPTQYLAGL
jgi:murein DD-endopeptidase MepM/ murein hydrolase activator NlpD